MQVTFFQSWYSSAGKRYRPGTYTVDPELFDELPSSVKVEGTPLKDIRAKAKKDKVKAVPPESSNPTKPDPDDED